MLWEILWEKALDTMSKYFNFKKTRKKTNPKPHGLLVKLKMKQNNYILLSHKIKHILPFLYF